MFKVGKAYKYYLFAAAEVPPIAVTITVSPAISNLFTGLQLNLTCCVFIPEELISVPLDVSAQWSRSGSILQSNSHVRVVEPVRVEPLLYQTIVVISSLDKDEGDEGDYVCTVKINSPHLEEVTVSSAETIEIPSGYSYIIMLQLLS